MYFDQDAVSRYDDTQFINDIDIQYINYLRRFSLIYLGFSNFYSGYCFTLHVKTRRKGGFDDSH